MDCRREIGVCPDTGIRGGPYIVAKDKNMKEE